MRIDFNNRIDFQASFVNKCTIGKYSKEKSCYINSDAYFVKLNPLDKNDIDVLDSITESWVDDIFSINVYSNANDIYQKNQKNENNNIVRVFRDFFYALTTQKDNFEHLDYEKVVGICDGRLFSDEEIYISHIQINPKYLPVGQPMFKFDPFEYKGLGSAIITSLKNLYSQIELSSRKEESVQNFYLKNGFKKKSDSTTGFIWEK